MIVLPSNLPATGTVNLTNNRLRRQTTYLSNRHPDRHRSAECVRRCDQCSASPAQDNYDEVLTIDFSGGNPIPSGGASFNGGSLGGGAGNSLVVNGTSGNDSVTMSATQITVNGSAPISYSNTTYFGFNLGAGSDSLLINQATLKINQDNAISAGTNVTIDAGTLDLSGKTDSISSLLLNSGSVINGTLHANSYIIESGTVTAAITGPGNLQKTTTEQATIGVVNTSNVTIDAGQLTVTSIYSNTLTMGAGTTLTIAPIAGGHQSALSSNSSLTPLATRALRPASSKSIAQPTAVNTVATVLSISNIGRYDRAACGKHCSSSAHCNN